MSDHPVEEAIEDQRVTAAGAEVFAVGMLLAPEDPDPRRQSKLVGGFLGPQHFKSLVGADERIERAAGSDIRGLELLFERRPMRVASLARDLRCLFHGNRSFLHRQWRVRRTFWVVSGQPV